MRSQPENFAEGMRVVISGCLSMVKFRANSINSKRPAFC